MKQIKITGGNTLSGEIKISGAKNSAVALVPEGTAPTQDKGFTVAIKVRVGTITPSPSPIPRTFKAR